MRLPRISDAQLDLLAQRLAVVGVGRRDFLRVAAGLAGARRHRLQHAHCCRRAEAEAWGETREGAASAVRRWQLVPPRPRKPRLQQGLLLRRHTELFAGLMKFNADFEAVPYVASKITPNVDGSVWTFALRKDSKWSDGTPCTARDFEWSWKRQLDPATAAPYASFMYDIKNAEAFNKKEITDPSMVGVRAKDDWTLEVTLEGHVATSLCWRRTLPRCRVTDLLSKSTVTSGPRPQTSSATDHSCWRRWEHNKSSCCEEEQALLRSQGHHAGEGHNPDHSRRLGHPPVREQRDRSFTTADGRSQAHAVGSRTAKEVFRFPYPATWYLLPQVTKAPFDNVKVRRAHRARGRSRERIVKVAQGFAVPAHSMIPPGFPGALTDQEDQGHPEVRSQARRWPAQGHAVRGRQKLAARHPFDARRGARQQAPGRGGTGNASRAPQLETELEVLEPRVFRERLWKQELQFVWIRWFMDYPDPHNEYFDTFYGKKTTGQATGLDERCLRPGARSRPRHARHEEAAGALCKGRGDHADGCGLRSRRLGRPLCGRQAVVRGIEKNKAGRDRR